MGNAGVGAISGSGFAFKLEGDGDAKIGNTSNDLIQVTGSLHMNDQVFFTSQGRLGLGTDSPGVKLVVAGNMAINEHIRHNGDTNTRISFPDNGKINLVADGKSVFKFDGSDIVLNNANENYDTKVMADNGQVVLHVDASHNRVGINTTSPSVDLDVDGTTKSTQYVTTVGTQDLGNGNSSTLSISAGVMILDADSIQGVPDAGSGMTVHTLSLPSGTTNGQRLTLIVNTTFGPGDNVVIMPSPTNIGGAFGALVANSKTSIEFVWYGSHWFPVQ